ncbi:MAG: DUF2339 domain-containing protein [Candidatus Uhrbacteria bacterium]|nr:DUF2339 domain-containing protein [Candidatus Uhrbacteria bacterium]
MTIFLFVLFAIFTASAFSKMSERIQKLESRINHLDPQSATKTEAAKLTANGLQPTTTPEPGAAPIITQKTSPKPQTDLEFKVGGKAFTVIGVIAVLFGAGFFLRYAFENNLISPLLRIILGIIASVACIGLGEWLQKKYKNYGQILIGLGLGLAYLVCYAALHQYHLIASSIAITIAIIVTAIGLALSAYHRSAPLAVVAQIGGFLTPIILGSDHQDPLIFFTYLFILNIATLALAFFQSWSSTALIGLIGTAIVFHAWTPSFFYTRTQEWVLPSVFATIFFLIFAVTSLTKYLYRRHSNTRMDLAVVALNPAIYAFTFYGLIPFVYRDWLGVFLGVLGAAYLGLTRLIQQKTKQDIQYQNALSIIGFVFIAMAPVITALHTDTIAIIWAVCVSALVAWGYLIRSRVLVVLAHALTFGIILRVVISNFIDTSIQTPWINQNFLTNVCIILTFAVTAAIHWHHHRKSQMPETITSLEAKSLFSLVTTEAFLLAAFVINHQVGALVSTKQVWGVAILGILFLVAGWIACAFSSLPLRVAVYASYALLALRTLALHTNTVSAREFMLNPRIYAISIFIASLAIFAFLIQKRYANNLREAERTAMRSVLFVAVHALVIWLISSEISGWFTRKIYALRNELPYSLVAAKNASLSIFWAIYALAVLVFGIMKRSLIARRFAIAFLGFTILKVFLVDTSSLSNLYRFASFMTLGILLLVVGYLYHRFRDQMKKFVAE